MKTNDLNLLNFRSSGCMVCASSCLSYFPIFRSRHNSSKESEDRDYYRQQHRDKDSMGRRSASKTAADAFDDLKRNLFDSFVGKGMNLKTAKADSKVVPRLIDKAGFTFAGLQKSYLLEQINGSEGDV
jgi:hypothetical protein